MRFIEIQQVLGARHNKHRKTLTALGLTAVAMGLRGAFRRRELPPAKPEFRTSEAPATSGGASPYHHSIGYGDSTDPGGGGACLPRQGGLPSATACCVSFGGPCSGPVRRRRGAGRRSSPAPVVGLDHLSQHHGHQRDEDDHGQDTQHDEGARSRRTSSRRAGRMLYATCRASRLDDHDAQHGSGAGIPAAQA